MSETQLANAFAKIRENFRAIAQFDASLFSLSTDIKLEITTTGTTTKASVALRSGNGTTSARKSQITFESLETSPQKWLAGINGTKSFAIRDETSAADRVVIDTAGNIGLGVTPVFGLHLVKAGTALGGTGFGSTLLVQDETNRRGVMFGYDTSGQIGIVAPSTASANSTLAFWTYNGGWGERMRIDATGSIVIGTAALATTATDGFLYIPSCAGVPTGTPTAQTGRVAIVYDSSNNKLYAYNGAWKSVTLA